MKTFWEITRKLYTCERFSWILANRAPYKVPGLNVIYPIFLRERIDLLIGPLSNIFRSSLSLSHVPAVWKIARVVFIPKAGKPSHVGIKDYKLISLIFFVLKIMKRGA